jgi:hypothetical protein
MSAPAMASPAVEAQRERLTDLDRAQREEREALDAFAALDERQTKLNRHGVWTNEDGDETIPQDAAERELLAFGLAEQRQAAVRAIVEARRRREVAAVELANAVLPELAEAHARTAEQVESAKAAFTAATVSFIATAWDYGAALSAESLAARQLVVTAREAAASEPAREQIKHVAGHRLPSRLDHDGPCEWVERPEPELYPRDARSDPRQLAFFDDVTEIARGGRERLRLISGPLAEALKRRG